MRAKYQGFKADRILPSRSSLSARLCFISNLIDAQKLKTSVLSSLGMSRVQSFSNLCGN